VQLLPDLYWPVLHVTVVQLDAPVEDVLPLEQLEHELELVPPVLERYLPAAHAVHELELVPPVLERYRPLAHAVQLLPVYPLEDW
jgi:hypothetical protein